MLVAQELFWQEQFINPSWVQIHNNIPKFHYPAKGVGRKIHDDLYFRCFHIPYQLMSQMGMLCILMEFFRYGELFSFLYRDNWSPLE